MHGEVLCDCATRGHDQLTLIEHLSPLPRVDVKSRVRVAGLIPFLVPNKSS